MYYTAYTFGYVGTTEMGSIQELAIYDAGLDASIRAYLCTPEGFGLRDPLPLLVANDGTELSTRADLLDKAGHAYFYPFSPELPPVRSHRIALLDPVDAVTGENFRSRWYTSPAYAKALAQTIMPTLLEAATTTDRRVALGFSLGGFSMVSCALRYPGTFDAVCSLSGSFWREGHESENQKYKREYHRVTERVAELHAGEQTDNPLLLTIACGQTEDNQACNAAMAGSLAAQGHDVTTEWMSVTHDFEPWRDVLEIPLGGLLRRSWPEPQRQAA